VTPPRLAMARVIPAAGAYSCGTFNSDAQSASCKGGLAADQVHERRGTMEVPAAILAALINLIAIALYHDKQAAVLNGNAASSSCTSGGGGTRSDHGMIVTI
jgi:hypothetical protein